MRSFYSNTYLVIFEVQSPSEYLVFQRSKGILQENFWSNPKVLVAGYTREVKYFKF